MTIPPVVPPIIITVVTYIGAYVWFTSIYEERHSSPFGSLFDALTFVLIMGATTIFNLIIWLLYAFID